MARGFPVDGQISPRSPHPPRSATLDRVKNSREIMEILEAYDLIPY